MLADHAVKLGQLLSTWEGLRPNLTLLLSIKMGHSSTFVY
jgi:hypothetical protein